MSDQQTEDQQKQAREQQERMEQLRQEQMRQFHEAQQRAAQEQRELQSKIRQAQMWAARTQQEINEMPRQQYAAIVAVDERGGFSKDGQIPWHYPEDFKWFKSKTAGQICVMGRTTYDDIDKRLGDKAIESVLPGRKCFVITSRPLERQNATVVSNISQVDNHLTQDDITKTVFFIGGERIYSEGIAKCDAAFVTVVNKDAECDKFFPVQYLLNHFSEKSVYQHESAPDLRFVVFSRKP